MRTFLKLCALILIDYILIWYFIYSADPDPSSSLLVIIYVPFVVLINLIVCIILAVKKKNDINIFFLNAIISGFLMYYIYSAGIDRHQNRMYEAWSFQREDTTFNITLTKADQSFDIFYSVHPGSSLGYLFGHCITRDNAKILLSDSLELMIRDGHLHGWHHSNDSILLTPHNR